MIKINWELNENEKSRIINLHETRTKNYYLLKEENGSVITDYPKCIQGFGQPKQNPNSPGTYYIEGTDDYVGYYFKVFFF